MGHGFDKSNGLLAAFLYMGMLRAKPPRRSGRVLIEGNRDVCVSATVACLLR